MSTNTGIAADDDTQRHSSRKSWRAFVRYSWFACAALAAIVLLGALPLYYGNFVQAIRADMGELNLSLQALVVLSDFISSWISYALGLLLFWRKPNDRMALLASFFFLITSVVAGYAFDYFLAAYFGAPSTYHIWSTLQTCLWVLVFCIFPDGRFVPRWTRWVFIFSIPLSLSIFVGPEAPFIFNLVALPLFILVVYGQVYRYLRVSSPAERQQTRWWVFGIAVGLVLAVIASIVYKKFAPPLLNVTPIFLAIAILRSRLWDIDIIIRRTLIYGTLTGILAFVYLASVLLLEQLSRQFTGQQQTDAVIVLSTLASAALFAPLRSRIQRVIDRRFYRRKYDTQKVLAGFAARARDEVDLNRLTDELMSVVEDTVQPAQVSLWLKASPLGKEVKR